METSIEKVEITEEESQRLYNIDDVGGFGEFKTQRHIFNIIAKYPDQKKHYMLNFETYMSDSRKNWYESFGLMMTRASLARDISNRHYMLIVEPNDNPELVRQQCEKFIKQNFPIGEKPTYFVVKARFTDYTQVEYWNNLLSALYPGIFPFAPYTELREEANRREALAEAQKELDSIQATVIPMDKAIARVLASANDTNKATLSRIKEMEEYVLSKYTGKEFLYIEDPSTQHIGPISAYMYYKYGIVPYLNRHDTVSFLNRLSNMLFDRRRMLVQDQFKYLLDLPDIMLKFNGSFEFLVFLSKSEMTRRVKISYVDADSPKTSSIEQADIDISQLNVIPLEYEYDLRGSFQEVKERHGQLLELFEVFEERLRKFDSTVNVTNSFFFEQNGIKYLAHIDEMFVKLPCLIYPINEELVMVNTDFGLDDISSLYPVNVIPGYKPHVAKALKVVHSHKVSRVNVYKHQQALGMMISYFSSWGTNPLNVDNADFLTVGLWAEEPYKYRTFLLKELCKFIELQELRKQSKHISVFGGPHPQIHESFDISEYILKE